MTLIKEQTEWARVAAELEAENLKLASYDKTLFGLLGNVTGQKMLDYGCGPGVLASALSRRGADVSIYDLSPDMQRLAGEKLGHDRVYHAVNDVPQNTFDAAICNLVLCIVDEDEVGRIARNLATSVKPDGTVYLGFCNPRIYDVPESNLDFREQTGCRYDKNHRYKKVKKEGGYQIIEEHRPIEWYERVFHDAGLRVVREHFTPEYELNGKRIEDFIIFELETKI